MSKKPCFSWKNDAFAVLAKIKNSGGKNMNKSEFIRAYADKLGITIKEADANFNAFVDTITDSLKKGEYIHISGFATFEIKDKAGRDGVNPLTGEKVRIKACKAPNVKFSKTFKDVFNQ
mgnify:FL=1